MKNEYAIDWAKEKNGTIFHMVDFPSIILVKLSDKTGFYDNNGDGMIVTIEDYLWNNEKTYDYFKTAQDSFHPLTIKLWEKNKK